MLRKQAEFRAAHRERPGRKQEFFEVPLAMKNIYPWWCTPGESAGSTIVLRPSAVTGSKYEAVSKAYSRALHSVLTRMRQLQQPPRRSRMSCLRSWAITGPNQQQVHTEIRRLCRSMGPRRLYQARRARASNDRFVLESLKPGFLSIPPETARRCQVSHGGRNGQFDLRTGITLSLHTVNSPPASLARSRMPCKP